MIFVYLFTNYNKKKNFFRKCVLSIYVTIMFTFANMKLTDMLTWFWLLHVIYDRLASFLTVIYCSHAWRTVPVWNPYSDDRRKGKSCLPQFMKDKRQS